MDNNTTKDLEIEVNGQKLHLNWSEYVKQHNFMLQKEQEWLNAHGLGWLSAGTPIKDPTPSK